MMLEDLLHPSLPLSPLPPDQLHIEEITSPLNAEIFEFCEPELFPQTLQNSEVASNSNCCYEEHSSYPTNLSLTSDMNNYTPTTIDKIDTQPGAPTLTRTSTFNSTAASTLRPNNNTSNLSLIFHSQEIENDISASIDFTPSPNFTVPQFLSAQDQDQFDLSSLNDHIQVFDTPDGSLVQYNPNTLVVPLMAPPLPLVYKDECLSSVPSYVRLSSSAPSRPSIDPAMGSYLPAVLSVENPGILTGNGLFPGSDLPSQDLDFQGDSGGIFCPDAMPRLYDCTSDFQSQHLIKGRANSTPLTSEITSLDDSTFKVGKLSAEERKEKIHRYMKKRNERNFSKKIKYACRKTLADSRPRVRGRFAKNDELAEAARAATTQHEDDTDEDRVGFLKDGDDFVDSPEIFAHISGVNSFKCNNSWI